MRLALIILSAAFFLAAPLVSVYYIRKRYQLSLGWTLSLIFGQGLAMFLLIFPLGGWYFLTAITAVFGRGTGLNALFEDGSALGAGYFIGVLPNLLCLLPLTFFALIGWEFYNNRKKQNEARKRKAAATAESNTEAE